MGDCDGCVKVRILIVEDDDALRQQLQEQLLQSGFVVEAAGDGEEGEYFAAQFNFDLAIVDLGLPKVDGVQLIKALRAQRIDLPVLVLTARSHWRDKVAGLEAGADDYLTKPFRMEELLARVNALIRRSAGHAMPVLEVGALRVDTVSQQVWVEDKTVELTAFEYRLLVQLLLHKGQVVSKAELTEHLYAQDFDRDSNVIEVLIGRLRRKLGSANLIQTVRGRGYRLVAERGVADA
jgi:two-component system response regulator PhoP